MKKKIEPLDHIPTFMAKKLADKYFAYFQEMERDLLLELTNLLKDPEHNFAVRVEPVVTFTELK